MTSFPGDRAMKAFENQGMEAMPILGPHSLGNVAPGERRKVLCLQGKAASGAD